MLSLTNMVNTTMDKKIDAKRRHERNRIYSEIQRLESYVRTNKATIERTRMSRVIDSDFAIHQVKKLKEKNENHRENISSLKDRLSMLKSGQLDDEIKSEFDRNAAIIKEKDVARRKHIREEKKIKEQKKKQSQEFYQATRESDRKFRRTKWEMIRSYKYYIRCVDSIPDYMIKKLNNMPNNKGYIWRGVYCYGNLPELG